MQARCKGQGRFWTFLRFKQGSGSSVVWRLFVLDSGVRPEPGSGVAGFGGLGGSG